MSKLQGMKLSQVIPRLIRVADLLAMAALFGTQEVSMTMMIPIGIMVCLSYLLGRYPGRIDQKNINRILFFSLMALVAIGLTLVFKTRLYPLIIATYTTMVVHGLMWFLQENNRTRSVRMLVGLVEVAVSAVLTPDLYIAFVIFCFVVVCSIETSLMFLEDQLSIYDSKKLREALPKGFLFHSFSVSVIVFFLSLVIFPILPRARTSLGGGWTSDQKTRTGYTEQVNLGVIQAWGASGADRAIALRVFLPNEISKSLWKIRIPNLLLRSRVLDRFQGMKWVPDIRNGIELEDRPFREVSDPGRMDPVRMEIIREPIESSFLPAPYGARGVELGTGTVDRTLHRSVTGTWFVPSTERRRLQYFVTAVFGEKQMDAPSPAHLEVPQMWIRQSARWMQLKEKIFGKLKNPADKLAAMARYFKTERYGASNENPLGESDHSTSLSASLRDPRKQLDIFLFSSKKGHCEYFASSAAFLLRLAGVPTRLIAGFRITDNPVGDVITVRQGDAHAWLEVWIPEKGWVAFDPTPTIQRTGSRVWDGLSFAQDYFSAYWYRYVLSFDQVEQYEKSVGAAKSAWKDIKLRPDGGGGGQKLLEWLLPVVLLALFLAFFLFLRFGFKLGSGNRWGGRFRQGYPWSLSWRLFRASIWFKSRVGRDFGPPSQFAFKSGAYQEWYTIADRLRYGPIPPGSAEWDARMGQLDQLWPQVRTETAPRQ